MATAGVRDFSDMELPYDPDQVPAGERRALLDRVPSGAAVLDVGCWSGFAGRYLGSARNASVDGIEPHAGMAAQAAADYRRVVNAPVEEAFSGDEFKDRAYDVVLFLDVLEHLVDPAAVLDQAIQRLAPGGRVLVSLPNAAHWSMRKELLLGRWRYTDSGLMDRTHLRFFTLATMRELLTGAGLDIQHEGYAIDRPPLIDLPPERRGLLRRWPQLFAVQGLFDAAVPGGAASVAR